MIVLFLMILIQWLSLLLEHALGMYGLFTATVLMGVVGMRDETKKWMYIVHTCMVSLYADVLFGRPLGQTALVFGILLCIWLYVARFSRTRVIAFLGLGLVAAFFLEPQGNNLLRVLSVLVVLWFFVRHIHMHTQSQEISLR